MVILRTRCFDRIQAFLGFHWLGFRIVYYGDGRDGVTLHQCYARGNGHMGIGQAQHLILQF